MPPALPVDKIEVHCIIADQSPSRILSLFNQMTWKTHFLNLHDLLATDDKLPTLSSQLDAITDHITGVNLVIVVDITSNHASPPSDVFPSLYSQSNETSHQLESSIYKSYIHLGNAGGDRRRRG